MHLLPAVEETLDCSRSCARRLVGEDKTSHLVSSQASASATTGDGRRDAGPREILRCLDERGELDDGHMADDRRPKAREGVYRARQEASRR